MREAECAGSKNCNDTVFTTFDLLAAPASPTCPQPALFRSGYDSAGAVHPATVTNEADAAREECDEVPPLPYPSQTSSITAEYLLMQLKASNGWRSHIGSTALWPLARPSLALAACEAVLRAVRLVATARNTPSGVPHSVLCPASPCARAHAQARAYPYSPSPGGHPIVPWWPPKSTFLSDSATYIYVAESDRKVDFSTSSLQLPHPPPVLLLAHPWPVGWYLRGHKNRPHCLPLPWERPGDWAINLGVITGGSPRCCTRVVTWRVLARS